MKIDGTAIRSVENSDPRTFENVQVFAGDIFMDTPNARYKNLEYERIERRPEGKLFMILKTISDNIF